MQTIYREWYRQGDQLLEEIKKCCPDEQTAAVWYLGQCGFVFKQHTTVYVDPVLNDITDEHGSSRRYYPAPFPPEKAEADYVLCTHGHLDHLAVDTLVGMAGADSHTRFIVPGACCSMLTDAGIDPDRVVGAAAKQPLAFPGLTVYPISAAHPVHAVDQEGRDTALCYHLTMGEVKLLHLGDTYLTDQLLEDLLALPRPHLFLPPINGGDYFRTKRDCIGNLSAIEAASLSALLQADITIPTHYDMIQGNTVDPLLFARELWEQNPAAKWHIPALGERFLYRI